MISLITNFFFYFHIILLNLFVTDNFLCQIFYRLVLKSSFLITFILTHYKLTIVLKSLNYLQCLRV